MLGAVLHMTKITNISADLDNMVPTSCLPSFMKTQNKILSAKSSAAISLIGAHHALSGESLQCCDCGWSYSNLQYVAHFPVNVVSQWFTQSFLGDLEGSPSQRSAITHQAMGWTESFRPRLEKLGCLTKKKVFKIHWNTRKGKTEEIFFQNSFLTQNSLLNINS